MPSDSTLERLSAAVGARLLARGHFITTAESCTGGWVAKALTDIAGSSQWFAQGWVTYGNEAKHAQLGVPLRVLARHGAVSGPVVESMARGALRRAGAHARIAIAVSGIAGPGGAVSGKPVGTVWFAWACRGARGIEVFTERRLFRGDRQQVRRRSVEFALKRVLTL
ncbi:MAG: nicotinamide-nucleotide amidohydrolase family protein [Steroidobacteraceae bacterium]